VRESEANVKRAGWSIVPVLATALFLGASVCQSWALEIKRSVLDNGAVLLVSEQHQLPMVTVSIAFDAGSRRDPAGKAGLASLTAASLTEGTRELNASQLNQKIDFMGSSLSVDAARDYVDASCVSLTRYFRDTLGMLAAVLTEPGLRDEDILRKRAEQIAGLKSAEEQPGYVAHRVFTELLFDHQPYGHLPEGDIDSVEKLTPSDVREFYHTYYRAGSAVIAVVGDVHADQVKSELEHDLAKLKGKVPPQPTPEAVQVPPGAHLTTVDRNVTQANIQLGFGGIARSNPDFYRLQVMNYILGGGGFASRLMKVVRAKQGLAYHVASRFSPGTFPGSFEVVLQTKNSTANQAINLVLEQLREIQSQPVSEADLEAAKKFLIGSFPLKIDRQSAIANFLIQLEVYGLGLDYAERYPKLIDAVTVSDVERVAQRYLHPDAYILVAVANQKEAEVHVPGQTASDAGHAASATQ
jgi:zinc protease